MEHYSLYYHGVQNPDEAVVENTHPFASLMFD